GDLVERLVLGVGGGGAGDVDDAATEDLDDPGHVGIGEGGFGLGLGDVAAEGEALLGGAVGVAVGGGSGVLHDTGAEPAHVGGDLGEGGLDAAAVLGSFDDGTGVGLVGAELEDEDPVFDGDGPSVVQPDVEGQ